MKKKIIAILLTLCLTAVLLTGCGGQTPTDNNTTPESPTESPKTNETSGENNSNENDAQGILDTYVYDLDECDVSGTNKYVLLSGSWYDMGVQYGVQARDYLVRHIVENLAGAIDSRGSLETAYSQLPSYEEHIASFFPEYIEFLKGISDETGFPYNDVLLAHVTLDMTWTPDEDAHQCSAVAAWGDTTESGNLLAAINADGDVSNAQQPIMIAFPENDNAFICGGNSVMSSAGLLVMATMGQSAQEGDMAQGTPICLAPIYLAAKYDNAIDAKDAYLEYCPPVGGENTTIVDTTGNNFIIEATASHYAVRSSGDFGEQNYLIVNNHFLTEEMSASLFPDDSYIDCPYRYATVEQFLKDNLGAVTMDTLRQAEASTRFYDYESGQWVDEWNLGTGLWSPENKHPHYFTYLRRVMDVTEGTYYAINGSQNTAVTHAPNALGTYSKVSLLEDPRAVVDQAIMDLELETWAAARDVDIVGAHGTDRMDDLSIAREKMLVAKNYYNQAVIAENEKDALTLFAGALTALCEGQCHAKAAQNEPTTLLTRIF